PGVAAGAGGESSRSTATIAIAKVRSRQGERAGQRFVQTRRRRYAGPGEDVREPRVSLGGGAPAGLPGRDPGGLDQPASELEDSVDRHRVVRTRDAEREQHSADRVEDG